jgi:hypothetical protein
MNFKQNTLFQDDTSLASGEGSVVVIVGSTRTLSTIQRRFNQLIARLQDQRQELARWKTFQQEFHERMARDYEPLSTQLRQKQIEMVKLLDRTLDGKGLGSKQRHKVFDIFSQILQDLLAEASDAELVRLYDKYADVAFTDEQKNAIETMTTLAREAFGIDTQDYSGGEGPEELAAWIGEQVRRSESEPAPSPKRKRKSRAGLSEAMANKTAEGGTRALREIFRKLVSELHPDREADPAKLLRKTDLMKEVNRAYAAGDLLRLLEIQLDIEQIDAAKIANLAEEQLGRYIKVFEEQSRRLREEIAEILEPFAMVTGRRSSTQLTPECVRRALQSDIQGLKHLLRDIESDLVRFQDTRQLKDSIRLYRIEPMEEEDWIPSPRRPQARGQRNSSGRT